MRKRNRTMKLSQKHTRGIQSREQDDLLAKFLDHVASSPAQIAIITTDFTLTYQQLYDDVVHWTLLFSEHIHGRAVVCLQRTPRLISVLLALQWLKITYIPVDPAMPMARLRAIVEDSEAQIILYDSNEHPDYGHLPCQQLALSEVVYNHLQAQLPSRPMTDALAYIIYTSGSTGKPKGVAVSRRALNNFLASMSRYFLNGEQELLLAITTIAFDIAALELYLPLWQHKTIFLANQEQHKDPFCITNLINEYPITLLQATPTMWKMLEGVDWSGKSKLVALCGGEPLTQTLAKRLITEVSELWNMYGPTEATVWCSLKQIRPNEPITIGRPIDNMEMYVLDAEHNILPPYVKGELFIGGIGLAEGYVNNDTLTQSRFIVVAKTLNKRLYRVGDIACSTPDGEFILFGRCDNQIKLHGFRIELEDIESHIQTVAGIRECVVMVYHEQLVAYLCLSEPELYSETELMNHLAADLPEYMLPKRVILLEKMPLTVGGKIDRRALPHPTLTTTMETKEVTPLQLTLISIWAEELGIPIVGLHDNFFELGGHSLSAARITARIDQQIEKKITLHDFYQAPTIMQLSQVIIEAQESAEPTPHKKKTFFGNGGWLPLNDFQLILWVSFLEPKLKKYNVVARRRIQGCLNKEALDLALQLVFQKHEVFSFTINKFYPAQKRRAKKSLHWIETSLTDMETDACEAYLLDSFHALFAHKSWRARAPMIIAKLFYLKDNQVEIQISMPHLIADENSLSIFFHDLSNAYLFYAHHTTLNAKESFHQFKSYTLKQNDISTQHTETDALFWKHYLQDTRLLSLPEQHIVRNTNTPFGVHSTRVEIPESTLTALRHFCVQNHVTLNDVLCAAIGLAIFSCCDDDTKFQHKLFMNTVKSTRDDPHYDNVIGCFLRLHPVKLDLSKSKSLAYLAKQVQQSTIETMEHQRASGLIKLASIGQLPCRKTSPKALLMSLATTLFSKVCHHAHIDPGILKACATLASFERYNNFLINVNILSNFFSDASKQKELLFGEPYKTIPSKSYPISVVEYVFDVSFLREDDQNIPYVIITSNLTPAFRERFGATLLKIIQQTNVAIEHAPSY